jgi:hypothetical protein
MIRFASAFAAFVLLVSPGAAAEIPVAYDLHAAVEPTAGTVAVKGTILVPQQSAAQELKFRLHRTFAVTKLTVNGEPAAFSYGIVEPTPFSPAARNVIVKLPAGAVRDGKVRLSLGYKGKLESIPEWGSAPDQQLAMDDQVNARMVELASYSAWYPQFFGFDHPIQTELEVSLPKGWTAVSSGAKRDLGIVDGRAVTRWSTPRTMDIVLAASPDFHVVTGKSGGVTIEVYHTKMPADVIAREARDLSAVMMYFTDVLGETAVPGGTIRHVYSPKVRGQGRAGIARPGLIVTSEGRVLGAMAAQPGYTLFQDIAHEIAHFWWSIGTGQGDWVNEAFAEYFSALSVEKLVSEKEFEAVLAGYRKNVAAISPDAPSLATVPADGSGFFVRYFKGSLMLDDFRRQMGDAAFFATARAFFQTYKNDRIGTAEFRSFWRPRLGDKAERVDLWLDLKGSAMP